MSRRRSGGRGRGAGPACSSDRFIRDSMEECNSLSGVISSVMEASASVAEDLQDGGTKYSDKLAKVQEQLLEFAKLDHTLSLVKSSLSGVDEVILEHSTNQNEDEPPEPPNLKDEFKKKLDALQSEDTFDPNSHPQVLELQRRLSDGEGGAEGETQTQGGEDEDEDIVLGQVQRSFKCPLTRKYLEDPVTSAVCKHSYSRAAILEHIRKSAGKRTNPRCPVCNVDIKEDDLSRDKELDRQVRRVVRKGGRSKGERGVVKL